MKWSQIIEQLDKLYKERTGIKDTSDDTVRKHDLDQQLVGILLCKDAVAEMAINQEIVTKVLDSEP